MRFPQELRRVLALLVDVGRYCGQNAALAVRVPPNGGGFGILHVVFSVVDIAEGKAATVAAALSLNAFAVAVNARLRVVARNRALDGNEVFSPCEPLSAALVAALRAHANATANDARAVVDDERFKLAAPRLDDSGQALAHALMVEGARSAAALIARANLPARVCENGREATDTPPEGRLSSNQSSHVSLTELMQTACVSGAPSSSCTRSMVSTMCSWHTL